MSKVRIQIDIAIPDNHIVTGLVLADILGDLSKYAGGHDSMDGQIVVESYDKSHNMLVSMKEVK